MGKIAVISDTHAKDPSKLNLRELEALNPDIVVHAGDFTKYSVYNFLSSIYNLKAVHGNCDDSKLKEELPEVLVFEHDSVKFGVKHEPLMPDFSDLYYLARELNVDVMIFGHIHRFALLKGSKGKSLPSPSTSPSTLPSLVPLTLPLPLVLCPGAFKNNQMVVLNVCGKKVCSKEVSLEFLKGGKVVDSLCFKIGQREIG